MEAAFVNSVIYRPAPACAQHARKKFAICLILWVIGLVIASTLTFSQHALGASGYTPIGDNPTIPASLSGVVFYDANHNGKLDTGEYAIGGGNVELLSGNNLIATAKVNSVGQYSFSDVDPGTYKLYNCVNGSWLAVPGTIYNCIDQDSSSSQAQGDGCNMYDVELNAGDQGSLFNYAAQYYPIQLLSKRMLLANAPPLTQAVPEPTTLFMLILTAIPFMFFAARWLNYKK
jgi:hypothetical protein